MYYNDTLWSGITINLVNDMGVVEVVCCDWNKKDDICPGCVHTHICACVCIFCVFVLGEKLQTLTTDTHVDLSNWTYLRDIIKWSQYIDSYMNKFIV